MKIKRKIKINYWGCQPQIINETMVPAIHCNGPIGILNIQIPIGAHFRFYPAALVPNTHIQHYKHNYSP